MAFFQSSSRNFTDICDRTGSRYWNLEFNQGKGVNITVAAGILNELKKAMAESR